MMLKVPNDPRSPREICAAMKAARERLRPPPPPQPPQPAPPPKPAQPPPGKRKISLLEPHDVLNRALDVLVQHPLPTTIPAVLRAFVHASGYHADAIIGPSRTHRLVMVRMLAQCVCFRMTRNSASRIGRDFRRDPATVQHALHYLPIVESEMRARGLPLVERERDQREAA